MQPSYVNMTVVCLCVRMVSNKFVLPSSNDAGGHRMCYVCSGRDDEFISCSESVSDFRCTLRTDTGNFTFCLQFLQGMMHALVHVQVPRSDHMSLSLSIIFISLLVLLFPRRPVSHAHILSP